VWTAWFHNIIIVIIIIIIIITIYMKFWPNVFEMTTDLNVNNWKAGK
jgi:anionic cell wall polymer biosynthesis LytR-Cps2A-Psr (LCP) family protein